MREIGTRLLGTAVLLAAAASCGMRKDGSDDDVRDSLHRAIDQTDDARRRFQADVKARLETIDEDLARLGKKIETAAEEERVRLRPLMDDLTRAKDAAAADLRSMGDAAKDEWAKLRDKVDVSVAHLETRVRDALK